MANWKDTTEVDNDEEEQTGFRARDSRFSGGGSSGGGSDEDEDPADSLEGRNEESIPRSPDDNASNTDPPGDDDGGDSGIDLDGRRNVSIPRSPDDNASNTDPPGDNDTNMDGDVDEGNTGDSGGYDEDKDPEREPAKPEIRNARIKKDGHIIGVQGGGDGWERASVIEVEAEIHNPKEGKRNVGYASYVGNHRIASEVYTLDGAGSGSGGGNTITSTQSTRIGWVPDIESMVDSNNEVKIFIEPTTSASIGGDIRSVGERIFIGTIKLTDEEIAEVSGKDHGPAHGDGSSSGGGDDTGGGSGGSSGDSDSGGGSEGSPDIGVVGAQFVGNSAEVGQQVSFRVTIKNRGTGTGSKVIDVLKDVSGRTAQVDRDKVTSIEVKNMEPGKVVSSDVKLVFNDAGQQTLFAGRHNDTIEVEDPGRGRVGGDDGDGGEEGGDGGRRPPRPPVQPPAEEPGMFEKAMNFAEENPAKTAVGLGGTAFLLNKMKK